MLFDYYLNDLNLIQQQNIPFNFEDSKLSLCILEEYYLELDLNSETLKLNLELEKKISRFVTLVNFYEQNFV